MARSIDNRFIRPERLDEEELTRIKAIQLEKTIEDIEEGASTITVSDITDLSASAGEINLLDLAGLTVGWVLSADSATTASWKSPMHTGTEFLDISEFDDTDATYYFYGGLDSAGDWKINRYVKTTFVMTSANEAGNPTKTSLALAWADRLTLSYS